MFANIKSFDSILTLLPETMMLVFYMFAFLFSGVLRNPFRSCFVEQASIAIRTLVLALNEKSKTSNTIDPRCRPTVVITIFTRVVCPPVSAFQILAKQNNFQVRIVIDTGGNVGLAEWIIDGIHV